MFYINSSPVGHYMWIANSSTLREGISTLKVVNFMDLVLRAYLFFLFRIKIYFFVPRQDHIFLLRGGTPLPLLFRTLRNSPPSYTGGIF